MTYFSIDIVQQTRVDGLPEFARLYPHEPIQSARSFSHAVFVGARTRSGVPGDEQAAAGFVVRQLEHHRDGKFYDKKRAQERELAHPKAGR